jgi:hypothetical protein
MGISKTMMMTTMTRSRFRRRTDRGSFSVSLTVAAIPKNLKPEQPSRRRALPLANLLELAERPCALARFYDEDHAHLAGEVIHRHQGMPVGKGLLVGLRQRPLTITGQFPRAPSTSAEYVIKKRNVSVVLA